MWLPVRRSSRRRAATALLLVAGGLLAACGADSSANGTSTQVPSTTSPSVATTSSRPSASPTALHQPTTKRQALAFAHAVNLTLADVPGFTVASPEKERETAAEKRFERDMLRCAGALGARSIAEASSKEFEVEHNLQTDSVSSGVSIARTSAIATEELAKLGSARTRACLSHYLNLLFKGKSREGLKVAPFTISAGAPPAPGATGSFGWHVTTAIAGHGLKIHIYMDFLGFLDGRAEVTLFTSSVSAPFPAAIEQRLFALLLERTKALTAGDVRVTASTHSA
jgi:hypothetical protein